MVWPISSRSRCIVSSMPALRSFIVFGNSFQCSSFSGITNSFLGFGRRSRDSRKLVKIDRDDLGLLAWIRRGPDTRSEFSSNSLRCNIDYTSNEVDSGTRNDDSTVLFNDLKQRFLSFKKEKYMKEPEHFQTLAEVQSPKFMVVACADSRVCPSNILGFQPGEAFMIRSVANLVPPLENGPSETNAALEFAVNTLEVENILVIGHSSCAGIEGLMNMQDDADSSSFVHNWIVKGKVAKLRTKDAVAHLSFDHQCRHCEKESINMSILNLLTYPWIEDKVKKQLLSLHGGYYNFLNCSFEKWTFDFSGSNFDKQGDRFSIKDQSFWY